MTPSQKILIKKLLAGHFLRKSKRGKVQLYVLYDAAVNPIQKIHWRTVEKITRFIDPEIKIWKYSKHGDMSLNLSMVRRLHGKNTIKQLYKKRNELTDSGSVYKKKVYTPKNKEANEKVLTLF